MTELAFHAIADIFPLMDGQPFADLTADIQQHGLREPIWLYEGQILDGRSRYKACNFFGLQPSYSFYTGQNPIGFCIALNAYYRKLSTSQRAMAAARLTTMSELKLWIA